MTVAEYPEARENHLPDRPRKLLVHGRELRRLPGRWRRRA
jgi:tmRNA-binding protein